jgi:hypothetical protein
MLSVAGPPPPTASRSRPLLAWLPLAVMAIAVPAVLWVMLSQGPLSLPGLALIGILGALGLGTVLYFVPQALVALPLPILPLPAVWMVFPYEIVFALIALVFLIIMIRRRAWAEMLRLEDVEVANLGFIVWATVSGLWCFDGLWWAIGVRRLLVGLAAFWVAYRLPLIFRRRAFEVGILLGAITLACAALAVRALSGYSTKQAALHRAEATNLGWGTANYVATLLLLVSPILVDAALDPRRRWLRRASWPTLGLITILQGIIASRAAGLLFVFGTIVQVFAHRSRQLLTAIAVFIGLIGFLVSPLGRDIVLRFTSPRELGSLATRVWYFRVAWRRTLDFFPWGMGENQGWVYADRLFEKDPHNYWLVLSSELGLPGLLLWITVLVLLWRRIQVVARDPEWKGVGRGLMVAFWVSQIHTLIEPTFQGFHYQFVYFWIMGGYLGYHALDARRRAAQVPIRSR